VTEYLSRYYIAPTQPVAVLRLDEGQRPAPVGSFVNNRQNEGPRCLAS
jgi:hypothetical protein